MICWFEHGVTDSFGPQLAPMECLGFLPGSACPHYDGEEQRRPVYTRLVAEGLPPGVAADDDVALRYVGTELREVVTSREGAAAYRVEPAGERVLETSAVALAPAAGAELRQPGKSSEPQPDRRQQHVEDDEGEAEEAPPQSPAPQGHRRLRFHLASGAAASAFRPSTVRRIRWAVSSIESSEMSITGHPSRFCTAAASSSSS